MADSTPSPPPSLSPRPRSRSRSPSPLASSGTSSESGLPEVYGLLVKTAAALERVSSRLLESLSIEGAVSKNAVQQSVRKIRGHLRNLSSVRRRLEDSAPLSSRPRGSISENDSSFLDAGEKSSRLSSSPDTRSENVSEDSADKNEKVTNDKKRSVVSESEAENCATDFLASPDDESSSVPKKNVQSERVESPKLEDDIEPPQDERCSPRKSKRLRNISTLTTEPQKNITDATQKGSKVDKQTSKRKGDREKLDSEDDSQEHNEKRDSENDCEGNSEKSNFKKCGKRKSTDIDRVTEDLSETNGKLESSKNNDFDDSNEKPLSIKCVDIKNLLLPEISSPFPSKSPKTVTFGNIETHKGSPSRSSPLPTKDTPVKSILIKNKYDNNFDSVSDDVLIKIKNDILNGVSKKPLVSLESVSLSGDSLVELLTIYNIKTFNSVKVEKCQKRNQAIDCDETVNVKSKNKSKLDNSSNVEGSENSNRKIKETRGKSKIIDEKEIQKKKLLMNSDDSEEEFDCNFRLIKNVKKKKNNDSSPEDEAMMGRSQRMKGRVEKCVPVVELDDSSSNESKASLNATIDLVENNDDENSIQNGSHVVPGVVSTSKVDAMDIIKRDLLDDNSSASESKMNGSQNGASSEDEVQMEENEDSDNEPSNKKKIKSQKENGQASDDDVDSLNKDEKTLGGTDSDDSEVFKPTRKKRKPKKKSSGESNDDSEGENEGKSKAKKRKRIKKLEGEDSDQESGEGSGSGDEQKKTGRKNIRKVKKSGNLDAATRIAAKKEKERLQRIAERQKLYNESMFDESGKPNEAAKLKKIVLDFDPETKEPSIQVDKGLVEKLKPHQANGIKFMWDACFESTKQISETKGSGCILAHCMGLGKTLQVVTLVHTLLTHQNLTKVERVLVVCPLSTVLNWVSEFRMWLKYAKCKEEVNIYELSRYKQNYERCNQLKDWLECGGVCVLGYEMFRNLSADNNKKYKKAQLNAFQRSLVDPGPDLVVCDEGHLLKNEKTSLSQSMNRVKTLRRIVLTGTPLQNNLKEYYCMVQFVKPNLLGKYNEYLNRFVNPITNGQYTDSTDHDIRVMKRRSHVLHKMLDGAVQRRDYSVLAPFLPPKHEYVLFISLTEIQIKLYSHYLENFSRRPQPDRKNTGFLFPDFQSLQRIWTHPLVLKANSERYELMQQKKRDKENSEDESEGSLVDFIDDDEDEELSTPLESSESDSEISLDSDDDAPKKKKKGKTQKVSHRRVTRANVDATKDLIIEPKIEERQENPTEWWMSLTSENELDDIRHSNKLLILLDILKMCDAIGDKLLVFSQSLYSLDLIEQFLSKIDDATQRGEESENLGGHSGSWSAGVDYFRLDGSTSCENRALWCKNFNREDNPRARLFLISTRAGGLGINLVAANRVVIFDMSWNPSHDVQSIFRVYRFGQKKPCYVYRFLALGTMEEKIYERQVTKQAISKRVIDEQQIDRHYAESDLAELYTFNPVPDGQREVPKLPKDRLFADLLKQHDTVIYKYHEHDSLLENKEEETLTEEERKAAWEDYENEKTRPPPTANFGNNFMFGLQQQQQQQIAISALSAVLRQDYPNLTEQQLATMAPVLLQRMYQNGDPVLMQKMNSMMGQNSMVGGFKYPTMGSQPMMMNTGGTSTGQLGGVQSSGFGPAWQQQQQMQLQQIQQRQNANMKYYAGGLGSRDAMDMAVLQQQQRAMLLGQSIRNPRGRPPKVTTSTEIVDLDSE